MDLNKVGGQKVSFRTPVVVDETNKEAIWKIHTVGKKRKRSNGGSDKAIPPIKLKRTISGCTDVAQSLDERAVEELDKFNRDLHESRKSHETTEDALDAEEDARTEVKWYHTIVDRMNNEGLSIDNLKGKNSEEAHKYLVDNEVITRSMSSNIKSDGVDLEGSPYW